MSSLVSAEITATCNALGYSDGAKYHTDPYCKETIKDLIRYLRRDDEDHGIRRHLGTSQVLQTDLLPILIEHSDDDEIFDLVLRLLVNLMSPVILLYNEELPAGKVSRNYYLQILTQLQSAKAAFADEKVWKVLVQKLSDILKLEWADRSDEKGLVIERILILARNVLHVPADLNTEKRPDNDATVHDQVLWAMHQAGLMDLFLYLASSENETQYYLHILEIISLIMRDQAPKLLADVSVTRSAEEKVKDNAALLNLRQKEIEEKAAKMKKYAGARHSRFGGSFVVKGVKSIGDRDIVLHKAPKEINMLTFDQNKIRVKTAKNKMPLADTSENRKSAYSIRLFLKEFCVEFLNGAYNPFMFSVREKISRGKAQPNDESYYFWALAFFMEFNRLYKFQIKLVSETMAVHIFHFVQNQLESWYEMMVTDKGKIPIWSKRMHLALKAYKELLLTLCEMDGSPDESVRESSKTVKSNIFYVVEYRELVFTLLSNFSLQKFTRSYLTDLMETVHIFLKLLHHYSKTTHKMVVQGKKKAYKKKSKNKKKQSASATKGPSKAALEMIWEVASSDVSALLQNPELIPTNVVPFDATLDLSVEEQKVEAMRKIRAHLRDGNVDQALGLLRAAREVWPENDCFGCADMEPDEEFLAVREIFMTNIGPSTVPLDNSGGESDDSSTDGDDEETEVALAEQSFEFFDFLKRFARPSVMQACYILLDQFEKNSDETNHYVVKMLHRIAFDCKLSAMLFQACVFRTFQRILNSRNPAHKELQKFAVYIIRNFVEAAEKNKLVFVELLFWKNSQEAFEVTEGYGTFEKKPVNTKRLWTEEQEQELRFLVEKYKTEMPDEPNMVTWVHENIINKERKRGNVMKKMKELGLIQPKIRKNKNSKLKSHQEMFENEDHLSAASDSESDGSVSNLEREINEGDPFDLLRNANNELHISSDESDSWLSNQKSDINQSKSHPGSHNTSLNEKNTGSHSDSDGELPENGHGVGIISSDESDNWLSNQNSLDSKSKSSSNSFSSRKNSKTQLNLDEKLSKKVNNETETSSDESDNWLSNQKSSVSKSKSSSTGNKSFSKRKNSDTVLDLDEKSSEKVNDETGISSDESDSLLTDLKRRMINESKPHPDSRPPLSNKRRTKSLLDSDEEMHENVDGGNSSSSNESVSLVSGQRSQMTKFESSQGSSSLLSSQKGPISLLDSDDESPAITNGGNISSSDESDSYASKRKVKRLRIDSDSD